MITFLDEKDVEHGALATIKVTNAVNGERSLTGEIESGDYVLSNIERGWRLRFDDEFYVVTYAKPIDDGKTTHVTFDAVHQFFWDFDKSSVHEQLNDGSHTFLTYLDFIFTGSDYTYTIAPLLKVYAFEKQSFGYKSRLKLFNDVITSSGVEFQVNGKVVRILEKTGTDLSTVVRKNFNMNELGIEKNIGDFVTYQKGFGAWIDENDHSKGRLVTEYTSPLASVYGKLEAEPLVDERYTQADNMIAALKANVDNSYSISVRLDMEDLTRAGYEYTQPRAGDYIMAINETLDFQEKIRIVSFTSEYDVTGQLVKHEVICNDIGAVKKLSASYSLTKEQAQNASDSVAKAVEMANKALVSADGKSTVYFGNEFPKDEPKGTLHKGDSLYLTVGDTTKMYYWVGSDWEELPIVNDVEAFKEQIADELKDVPNREEFEATITEKLATSKAEIETQIDTAKTQAESSAKAYADEINQVTAEVAEQANTTANSLKSDLAKVKTDLTATTSTANAAKTSASEAKQQLTTVADDLSKAKTDLQAQASQLTAQANAQSELTNRVSSVEETANGTKTTVSELSKTIDSNTKNITSVTARTKTVEDDLTSTKTTLSQVQTTANSASQKTATLETGLDGVKADLAATTTTANTTKTNLANYQASNDQAVANLQSSLQTTNGNVSSLQTKIEAVPGQITSAVSAVEGKIPTNVSTRNLILKSNDFANPHKQNGTNTTITSTDDYFVIKSTGYTANTWGGMAWNMSISEVKAGEEFSILMPVYIDSSVNLDSAFSFNIKNHLSNSIAYSHDIPVTKKDEWFNVAITFKAYMDVVLDTYPFYVYLVKNGLVRIKPPMLVRGNLIPSDYQPAFEDTESDISAVSSELKQTKDGMTLLATKTELNSAKTELQSGIAAATNKADNAQSTANTNAQTISTHTTQISALNTGLQAKVSQSDFDSLGGRVTIAENNITAKANELSSKITSVEGKIPSGEMNLAEYGRPADGYSPYAGAEYTTHPFYYNSAYKMYIIKNTATSEKVFGLNRFKVERNTDYTLYFKGFNNGAVTNMDVWFLKRVNGSTKDWDSAQILVGGRKLSTSKAEDVSVTFNTGNYDEGYIRFDNNGSETAGTQADLYFGDVSVKKGKSNNGWSPSSAELASSQDLKNAQSEIKQTTDSITASVATLDSMTVKSASLTIGTDGVVMKAGKSTTDIANAIGSYFSVNQNSINLFSDKINVKGSMVVDGAITSTKIASKSINTAHLNGKIITADVIATGAITADSIKAGAVTTSAMSANSINGDRITAGTLDAAKIKAGSITASQIASGTITSAQIKTGTISAGNIATGAITTDKIAANSINSDKIVSSGITANVIKGGKLQSLTNTTNFDLDTGKLFYNNNNTGVFRVEDGASTMGLKFSNTAITVNNTSRILSRVILGGDRRETTLDDGKWDQGGFTGIVAETINGVDSDQHAQADTLRVIGDNIYFTHSYNYDSLTSTSAQGWKMETFSPFSSYAGNVVLKPYGINYRQSDIITGDIRLDNGDGSGYWVRGCIRTLRNCFQHYLNGGTSSGAMNAIRDALREISGV